MPAWLQAVILGIVQGLTEFIPVSSSGHLVIVPYLAGWEDPGLAFDVALHVGTAAAVTLFFRRELFAMARGLLTGGRDPDAAIYRRLALYVVVGTIPVALVGLFAEEYVAQVTEEPLLVAGMLLVTALLLGLGEYSRSRRVSRAANAAVTAPAQRVWTGSWIGEPSAAGMHDSVGALPVGDDPADPAGTTLDGMGLRNVVVIGLLQTLALLPGVSRSGSTITAGLFTGMTREAATRFSFLLSLPALVGAFVLSLGDLSEPGPYSAGAIAAGVLASFVSGYVAVRFLVRLVARDRLTGFARYCVFLAIVTVVAYQFLGPPSSV